MNCREQKRGLVLIPLVLYALLLAGCTQLEGSTKADYYTGYNGVNMQITQAMPPAKIYYYGDSEDNSFDVNVQVSNKGSSWSRGGIYLSGYDPNMIQIKGIVPGHSSGPCTLDIGNIGFGMFGGFFSCNNFNIGGDLSNPGNYFEVSARNLFASGGPYAGNWDLSRILGNGGMDFWCRKTGDNGRCSVDFNNPNIDVAYANHGRLLITMLQGIDFNRTFGMEYFLAGNTYEYPGGEMAYLNFDGNIISWPPGLDKTDQTFLITNCFLYATYAAPIVCIDPSPFSENQKVCSPKSYAGTSGQGAPVAVTSIEQENNPRQAIFTIHIKNVGGGRVYDPGMLEVCSPYSPVRVTNEQLNVVYIGDIRVSGDLQRLECTPNDFVRLDPKTGEGIVTCAYDVPYSGLKSAYQAPLVVELWYGYEKTVSRTVTIKRAV